MKSSPTIPGFSAANRSIYDPCIICRCWRPSRVPCGTARRSRAGSCRLRWHDCGASLGRDDADRRFVRVLAAVLDVDGLEAVEAAVREALLAGVASDDVIVNILARRREPPRTADYCHARRPGAAPSAPRRLQPL